MGIGTMQIRSKDCEVLIHKNRSQAGGDVCPKLRFHQTQQNLAAQKGGYKSVISGCLKKI